MDPITLATKLLATECIRVKEEKEKEKEKEKGIKRNRNQPTSNDGFITPLKRACNIKKNSTINNNRLGKPPSLLVTHRGSRFRHVTHLRPQSAPPKTPREMLKQIKTSSSSNTSNLTTKKKKKIKDLSLKFPDISFTDTDSELASFSLAKISSIAKAGKQRATSVPISGNTLSASPVPWKVPRTVGGVSHKLEILLDLKLTTPTPRPMSSFPTPIPKEQQNEWNDSELTVAEVKSEKVVDEKREAILLKAQKVMRITELVCTEDPTHVTPENEEEIISTLKELCLFMGANRTYVFLLSIKGDSLANLFEWCCEGTEYHSKEDMMGVSVTVFPWSMQHFTQGKTVLVGDIYKLPQPLAAPELGSCVAMNIHTYINVPIMMPDAETGALQCAGWLGADYDQSTYNKWFKSKEQPMIHEKKGCIIS